MLTPTIRRSGLTAIVESPRENLSMQEALQKVIQVWKSNVSKQQKTQEWKLFIACFPGVDRKIIKNGMDLFQRRQRIPVYLSKSAAEIEADVMLLINRRNPAILESFHYDYFISKIASND